jgi:hypothetical protein
LAGVGGVGDGGMIVQGGLFVAHDLPAALIFETQQFAAPPGLSAQAVPPQSPQDLAQQISAFLLPVPLMPVAHAGSADRALNADAMLKGSKKTSTWRLERVPIAHLHYFR